MTLETHDPASLLRQATSLVSWTCTALGSGLIHAVSWPTASIVFQPHPVISKDLELCKHLHLDNFDCFGKALVAFRPLTAQHRLPVRAIRPTWYICAAWPVNCSASSAQILTGCMSFLLPGQNAALRILLTCQNTRSCTALDRLRLHASLPIVLRKTATRCRPSARRQIALQPPMVRTRKPRFPGRAKKLHLMLKKVRQSFFSPSFVLETVMRFILVKNARGRAAGQPCHRGLRPNPGAWVHEQGANGGLSAGSVNCCLDAASHLIQDIVDPRFTTSVTCGAWPDLSTL